MRNSLFYYQKKEKSWNKEAIFKKYQQLSHLNYLIIQEFIDKIYIGNVNSKNNTRDIQIKWNF